MAKPVVDRLERDLTGRLRVLRLSAWSPVGQQMAARYGVRGVPTFILFDGSGQVVFSQVGRLDAGRVEAELSLLER